jgi:hypothetical protein
MYIHTPAVVSLAYTAGTVAAGPPEALPFAACRRRDRVAAEVSAHGSGW